MSTFAAFMAGLALPWLFGLGLLLSIILVVSFNTRSYTWFASFLVLGLVAIHFTAYSPYSWAWANKLDLLKFTAIYLVIGSGWTVFAWFLFINKVAKKYAVVRAKWLPSFLATKNLTELSEVHYNDFREYLYDKAGHELPRHNLKMDTSIMAANIVFWPFKMIGFFLGDAIQLAVDFIVARFGGLFMAIQRWVFRKFPEIKL